MTSGLRTDRRQSLRREVFCGISGNHNLRFRNMKRWSKLAIFNSWNEFWKADNPCEMLLRLENVKQFRKIFYFPVNASENDR